MKRIICLTLAVIMAFAAAGCAKKETPRPLALTAVNEIATYKRVDPAKTVITVSSLGNNANIAGLSEAFEKANPDVEVICFDLTGGTSDYRPVMDWVQHGVAPDVMFMNENSFPEYDEPNVSRFEDLSSSKAVSAFESEALSRLAVNGHIYFLPAPSEINCMIYNKTLFEKYGW